jgi:class 3 adenylate cyclase
MDAPMMPATRYAVTDDGVYIAYQTIGDGPVDVVFVHAFVSHVEVFWELPSFARFMRELSATSRVIVFDKRGAGLSDRLSGVPTLEARMDDLSAVLDAIGAERALIVGDGDGAALAAMFAATYPDRTLGLVLWGGSVRMAAAPDYPWGMPQEAFERRLAARMSMWGDAARAEETTRMTFMMIGEQLAADPHFPQWLVKLQRHSTAPGDLARFSRIWFSTDARSVLPAIQVPTVVLVRQGWPAPVIEEAEWTADRIPGTRIERLPGNEDDPYLGNVSDVVGAIERFVASIHEEQAVFDRVLATVLFTDIVGATGRAEHEGDRAWKALVEQHHARIRGLLRRFRGHEVDTAGDGFFATFDGPARAVRCAAAIIESVERLGLQVRAGIHTGEVETIDGKAAGLTVMIGARIGAYAGPSEILTSQTVRDLTAGSGLQFEDAGERQLKGVTGPWRLSRVTQPGATVHAH